MFQRSPTSARGSKGVARRYLPALRKHLASGQRASLRAAVTLGREAVAAGLETTDLAKIHERALMTLVVPGDSSGSQNGKIARAAAFFIEALTPIDHTFRAAVEKNGHLHRLNGTVRDRTVELDATRRELKLESARRKTLEAALKKSEQHYGQLLKKSRRMQEHLRRLSHEILFAQEQERKKISRELHDEIGQTLTAINVRLATLKTEATVTSKDLKRAISSTQRLVERSMNSVHRFARELRPPVLDDLGLIPALHALMRAFTKRTRIPVRFTTFAAVEKLGGDRRTVLYRVAQEAFENIAKHAHASLVIANIQKGKGFIRMEIRDNGKSFDVKRLLVAKAILRLGLLGMRERVEMVGGTFEIDSERGKGTTIRAQIPFAGRAK